MLKFYEYAPSPNCARARFALEEAGQRYQPVRVDLDGGEHRSPKFLALNPTGQIPVLVDGATKVFGSAAIVLHAAERWAKAGLLPKGAPARAEALSWFFWAARLNEVTWALFEEVRLPEEKRDAALMAHQREALHDRLALLEGRLAKKKHLAGAFSLADVSAFPTTRLLPLIGVEVAKFPQVAAWRARVGKRPAWKRVEAIYYPPKKD